MIFGINSARDISKLSQISLTITARERDITSDNFEIQPQIMLLPMQMPYKVPIYECTSAFFVRVQGKCCLVSQISRRDHAFMLA